LQVALDALRSASHPHSFLGIDEDGLTAIIDTRGNPWTHLVLRGGRNGPNYEPTFVDEAIGALRKLNLPERVMVDCSHANANKKYQNQAVVWKSVVAQRAGGTRGVLGIMLESNLVEGSQALTDDPSKLRYGVSVTDECIGWEQTEELLRGAHASLGAHS
jgi:3-deoxy-7-phosphoheptulonate synthase